MSSIAPLDLSEAAGAQAWIAAAVEQHGGIDILYNNAGNTRFGSFPDVPVEVSMVDRTYNHRPGNAEEVAAAALFLVSDESSYLSGAKPRR